MRRFPDRHTHDCGLVVNPRFSFLGASPDGKVCCSGETGILKIKCLLKLTIAEALATLDKFCLEKDANNTPCLKRNHDYYIYMRRFKGNCL